MSFSGLQKEDTSAGWIGMLPNAKRYPQLSGTVSVPWVVIGAGFSGVAAARRIAELAPQAEVVLIDAAGMGQGSAGRSSGFVVSIGHFNNRSRQTNQRIFTLGRAGIDSLRASVERFQIQCQWNDDGRLIGASSRSASRTLARICQIFDGIGAAYEKIEPESIRELTGMVGVQKAIRQIDSVLVQPAALLSGLIENLPSNVTVYENSPVTNINTGKRMVIECAEGTLRADSIVLTTNALLPSFGLARNRVFPMRTFASFAIPERAGNELNSNESEWGYTSAERVGSSFRRLSEGQTLVRNTAFFGIGPTTEEDELRHVSEIHRATLQRRFPDAGPWKIDQTWSGLIGITANSAVYFDQPRPNVYAVAGHNGHGISHGTIAGELLADWALERSTPLLEDMKRLPRPTWIPRGPILKAGVGSALAFLNWRLRGEL